MHSLLKRKHSLSLILFTLIVLFFVSCTKEVDYNNPYSGTEIKFFEVANMVSPSNIDLATKIINVPVASNIDLSNITATFVLSDGATASIDGKLQESGKTKNDFRDTVHYLVTSGNKENKTDWKVILIKQEGPGKPSEANKKLTGLIQEDRTLAPAIYNVTEDLIIGNNVTLEIMSGTKFLIENGRSIRVKEGGQIIALGTSNVPITFESKTENEKWNGIYLEDAKATFTFCIFKNGGENNAMLHLKNSIANIKNSHFLESKNNGIYLDKTSSFVVFEMNTITNCGETLENAYPLFLEDINAVSTISNTNNITTYKGIFIQNSKTTSNIKFFGQKCPFIFSNNIIFDKSKLSVIILPGVKFRLNSGSSIKIAENYKVKFYAQGTAEQPIIFETDKTEDWQGVFIGKNLLKGSKLSYCYVKYAGSHYDSKTTGAITCKGTTIDNLEISNCSIISPNTHGLYFFKNSDATLIDNNFENVPSNNSNILYEE